MRAQTKRKKLTIILNDSHWFVMVLYICNDPKSSKLSSMVGRTMSVLNNKTARRVYFNLWISLSRFPHRFLFNPGQTDRDNHRKCQDNSVGSLKLRTKWDSVSMIVLSEKIDPDWRILICAVCQSDCTFVGWFVLFVCRSVHWFFACLPVGLMLLFVFSVCLSAQEWFWVWISLRGWPFLA